MNRIYPLFTINNSTRAKAEASILNVKLRKDVKLKLTIPKPYKTPDLGKLEKTLKEECGKHLFNLCFQLIRVEEKEDIANISFIIPKISELSDFFQIEDALEKAFEVPVNLSEQSVEYIDDGIKPHKESANRLKACGTITLFENEDYKDQGFEDKFDLFNWWMGGTRPDDDSYLSN